MGQALFAELTWEVGDVACCSAVVSVRKVAQNIQQPPPHGTH